MNALTITCHVYNTWAEAHAAHLSDFCVYMFDVLPPDEMCVPGIKSYIGSAGANATREKENKSSGASKPYVKGSFDARYRGGSYTKNHTRPQQVIVFTISRNQKLVNESTKEWRARANAPGFKRDERVILGVLEYQLHQFAIAQGIALNNGENPKCVDCELKQMDTRTFFNHVNWEGEIPTFIKLGKGELTLDQIRAEQKAYAIEFFTNGLKALQS